jgi:hypothetical protein
MSVERSWERHRKRSSTVYEVVLAHERANKCEEKISRKAGPRMDANIKHEGTRRENPNRRQAVDLRR